MNPERWKQIEQIYHSALQLEPGRREVYLKEACAQDETLLKEVGSLLAQEGNSGGLFKSPALDAVAQALAQDQAQKPQENLIGQTVSHYRIEGKIGEGGMGVVFLAQDTSLHRKVAMKFLPPEMQQDPLARKRFLREARSAAALDNLYICSIHEVGEFEGRDFIVMEYVDGQTLMDKLRHGRLPLNQALQIAMEVAEALQGAHSKGIIHRDLKPSNIMIMKTGHAMVMDFGLAKQIVPRAGIESKEESATEMTRSGMTLGTLAYMSPEQLRGEEVDTRSDIFSFGLVIYEMLTGRHPFRKESPMETGSAILHEEPKPVGAITQGIPPDLEKLVGRCLRKDLERRFQHIGDVKIALLEVKEDLDSGRLQAAPVAARQARFVLPVVIVVIGLIAAGWHWLTRQRAGGLEAQPTAVPLTSYPGFEFAPSFSPDGTQVVFQWCSEGRGANCHIYVKQIGVEEQPSPLTKDPAADFSPAWSPDGLFIAFLRKLSPTRVALMIIPQRGGKERPLAESDFNFDPELERDSFLAWTPDSKGIVFPSSKPPEGLLLLHIETGEIQRLTTTPSDSGGDYAPAFSPDGRILAFTRGEGEVRYGLFFLRLTPDFMPQAEPERVGPVGKYYSHAAWLPDESDIVFVSDLHQGGLLRMPVSASATPRKLAFASQQAFTPALSRLGNRLAYAVLKEDLNIWRIDLRDSNSESDTPRQFISSTRVDFDPAYSPDGKRIAFASDRSGNMEIWLCDSDGSNPSKLTSIGGTRPRWSPDGRSIAFTGDHNTKSYIISVNGGAPRPLSPGPGRIKWPDWSRDGQSIYFVSDRGGSDHIWKMSVTGGGAVQITPAGDRDLPQESPDEKFIYYQKGWPTQCSVWRMAVGGGEETVVLNSVHCECGWTLCQQGIYFFRPADEKGHSDLCVYEFATGNTRKMSTIERPVSYRMAASIDGQTILYPQVDESGSDLMLVEKFR